MCLVGFFACNVSEKVMEILRDVLSFLFLMLLGLFIYWIEIKLSFQLSSR